MKRSFLRQVCLFFLILLLLGCSFAKSETNADHLTIVSWNVQNLFDGTDNGFEYAEGQSGKGRIERVYS